MGTLYIKFSSDVTTDYDLPFKSTPKSFISDHAVNLKPIKINGFKPILGEGTIETTSLEPGTIYDEFESTYFRAHTNSEKILLKFAFEEHSREDFELEAQAYIRLRKLQGQIISSFRGLYKIVDDPYAVCLITIDVGDSIPVEKPLYFLPKEDRMEIARLLSRLCTSQVCLDALGSHHLLRGDNQYWLHSLGDIEDHKCDTGREAQDDGQSETDFIFREFKCNRVQLEMSGLRLWNWPRPYKVTIDHMPYPQAEYPPQALIDKLWLPIMAGTPVFFVNWYRGIKSFMDDENLDMENATDMERIIAFSEGTKDKLHFPRSKVTAD